MSEIYTNIGKRLREIRQKGAEYITKQKMAELFNITVEHYDSLERGRYLPSVEILSMMNKYNHDIDYLLTGKRTKESVFSEIFVQLNDNEKLEVEKLLLYKMRLLIGRDANNTIVETKIKSYKNTDITPYERVRDIIEQENNCKRMSNYELALQLGVSERTINRLNRGESQLNTDIILNIYYRYNYYPSYVVCGELNSNSKIDQLYKSSGKMIKDILLDCARELAAYCEAGKIDD